MKASTRKTHLSPLLEMIFFSRNKGRGATRLPLDSTQVFFQLQKQLLGERISLETENIERKIHDLSQKKEIRKLNVDFLVQEELDNLKTKKNQLKTAWKKLEQITKENWKNFEQNVEHLLNEKEWIKKHI